MVCIFLLIIIGIMAQPIVNILFSSRFLAAVPVIWVLLPGIAVRCISKLILPYLNGTNRPGIQSWATIASLIADFAGLAILYPIFGLLGAGAAMSISYLINSIILAVAFHKFSGMSIRAGWFPRKADLLKMEQGLVYVMMKIHTGRYR